MPDEITLGELSRRLERFEQRHDRQMADMDNRCNQRASAHVDTQLYAAEKLHLADQIADLHADVKALEARMTWAWRAAMTGLIFPVVLMIVGGILLVRGPA